MPSPGLKSLIIAMLACGAFGSAHAQAATQATSASALPACGTANFDNARNLYTITKPGYTISRASGEPVDANDAVIEVSDLPLNQQCVLTVVPAGAVGNNQLVAGRYTIYFSNGGDGGAGGTARYNGGGGGGAGAQQRSMTINLAPGQYKMVLGAGGPGGVACRDPLPGGPGWPGSPTALISMDTGRAVFGQDRADQWQRPSRRQLENLKGVADGHGGHGVGKTSGGNGGANLAANETYGATGGSIDNVAWTQGKGGDKGEGERPLVLAGIGSGGGGGAGLGDGGDGAGRNPVAPAIATPATLVASNGSEENQSAPPPPAPKTQTIVELPEMGGLGAGGGGGLGENYRCTAGGPGGPGYIAFRKI